MHDTDHDWDAHHARAHAHGHEHGHGARADDPASQAELAGFLAGLERRPQRAVDLGCGTGADAVFLAQQGIATSGLDGSGAAIERARERAATAGVEVEWIHGDALALPFADASIDLLTDRGLLHHFTSEEQVRYAEEVQRVLAPRGVLLVREMNQVGHHAHAVDEAGLHAMVESTALELRSVVTYGRTMLAVIGHETNGH